MAFGQIKRTDFSGPEFHNSIMNFLGTAGGKFPVGTTFPNHVAMGVQVADATSGKYQALRITEVEAGSPAQEAGIQVGDVVTRVANKRFKTGEDYLDATAKAANKPTYDVEVLRAGQPVKLTVKRAFRPTWTEQVIAAVDASAEMKPAVAFASVADELTKLAKLKEDGIISEAEFESQKKKLLEQ